MRVLSGRSLSHFLETRHQGLSLWIEVRYGWISHFEVQYSTQIREVDSSLQSTMNVKPSSTLCLMNSNKQTLSRDFLTFRALPGLLYLDDFIPPSLERSLLSGLHAHPHAWKHLNNRTLQNWGGLPHSKGMIATPLPPFLQPLCAALVSAGLFTHALPPNHVLANRYRPGQGIDAHVDGPAYIPCAAIVSLSAPIVMDFYAVTGDQPGVRKETPPSASLLLRKRSIVVLRGDVYTGFLHAIAEREEDVIDERILNREEGDAPVILRTERLSLTVRRSCKTIRNPLVGFKRR